MNKHLFILLCIIFISCNRNESNEHVDLLKEKFHGKYEIITSVSGEAVDLNMDGISSTDLLQENIELLDAGLEIRVLGADNNLFEEKWPVEYIGLPKGAAFDSMHYHPEYLIMYAVYANASMCRFEDNGKTIRLLDDFVQNQANQLIGIESVSIEEKEILKVVSMRKLYTINGWKTTKIVSRYKRFTIFT